MERECVFDKRVDENLWFGMASSLHDFHWKPLLTRNVLTSHGECTDHGHPEIVSVYN